MFAKGVVLSYLLMITSLAYAQSSLVFIPLQHETYEYYDYQITAGLMSSRFILNQPYRLQDLNFLQRTRANQYFKVYWNQILKSQKANLMFISQEAVKIDSRPLNRYRFDGGISYTNDFITFANQFTMNQDYKYDRRFAGNLSDADHWIFGRLNEAYVDIHLPKLNIFFGRTPRNWGPLGDYSLILSNNPYTYDHLLIALELESIKFSFVYAQLDSRDALVNDNKEKSVISVKNASRNLVGYRLDIHFSNSFQIGLTQTATYGGVNRPFEWAFLNPMNLNFLIQHNEQIQNDAFAAVDLFWKPFQKSAIWGQFLVDDIVVNNDPGVNSRAKGPDRLAFFASWRVADWMFDESQWALTYVRIWNRTYQSVYTWENYHYRDYSLGYPASSLEEFKLKFSSWRFFPTFLFGELIYGRYGHVAITDLFPLSKEPFPVPPVTRNLIAHIGLRYFYSPRVKFFSDVYYRKEPKHYSNRFNERSNWVLKLGISYLLNLSLKAE